MDDSADVMAVEVDASSAFDDLETLLSYLEIISTSRLPI